MKDQLIRYIDLLFAGAPNAGDIKQEILQNTLDRYDDLIAQGKSPQAAYQLAISGIGDINELLSSVSPEHAASCPSPEVRGTDTKNKKLFRAIAVALYILCPVPLFLLQNEAGLCGLLVFVAVATVLMVLAGNSKDAVKEAVPGKETPLRKSVSALIWAICLCVYFLLSFSTQAWYITWVLFPMAAAVQGLVFACMDLKEANRYEK